MNRFRKRELRRSYVTEFRTRRDAYAIANALSLLRPALPELVSDRRLYNPTRTIAPPFSYRRSAARLVAGRPAARDLVKQTKAVVAFAEPRLVEICRRRHVRKAVMHAKGVAGSRVRRPRRNEWSDVAC